MSKEKPKYNEVIFSEQQERNIIDLYLNKNISTVKIGQLYNCSHKVIARLLERHGIKRTGNSRRKYKMNEYFFDNIDTEEKAYCLGFLYADGCNYIKKQTVSMSLQEEDYEILEKVRLCIGSERKLEFIDNSNKHDFGYTYKNQWRLSLFSKHMCSTLEKIGMTPSKSLTLTFPNIPKTLYRHFIRGYFDGDGSVYKYYVNDNNKPVTLTITSTNTFCEKIKDILNNELGIYVGIYDASNHNGITKVLSMSTSASKSFLDWIYFDATIYMKRKYERYIQYFYNNAA